MTGVLHPTRDTIVLAKVEPTYGVPGTIDITNYVDGAYDIEIDVPPISTELLAQAGVHGKRPGTVAFREVTVSMKVPLRGFGAAYSVTDLPPFHPLIKACSVAHAVDATPSSESVTYTPASSGQASTALRIYEAGMIWDIYGCVGTFTLSASVHEFPVLEFNFTGLYAVPVDGALLGGFTISTVKPPIYKSSNIVMSTHGTYPIISEFSLDAAVQVGIAEDAKQANGLKCLRVVDRAPALSMNPLVEDGLTNIDPYTAIEAGTLYDLAIPLGSVQYERFTLNVDYAKLMEAPRAEREGLAAWDWNFDATWNSGDDDWELVAD